MECSNNRKKQSRADTGPRNQGVGLRYECAYVCVLARGLPPSPPALLAHSLGVDVVHRPPRRGHEDEVQEQHRRSAVRYLMWAENVYFTDKL